MNVLGIVWALGSTAALYRDGKIEAAVSEERFTRVKNDDAFPEHAIRSMLGDHQLAASDLDGVGIATLEHDLLNHLKRPSRWSIDDYIDEQNNYWAPKLLRGEEVSEAEFHRKRLDFSVLPLDDYCDETNFEAKIENYPQDRIDIVARYLGIGRDRVKLIEHHRAHTYYAYYSSPYRKEPVLSLTIDAHGDGLNATVGVFDEAGSYKRLFGTANCHIARVYRYMTLVLGMKPNEHEFKVMGLAPYGKPKIAAKALDVFRSTLYVDGLDFKWNIKPSDSYFWFKEKLEGCRFDGIAAALQQWTEELLETWVGNAVRETGIGTVVLSGGVAMNVKANGRISDLPEIKKIFVGGSSTDESLALGSALCLAEDISGDRWKAEAVPYLESLYLGPNASQRDEKAVVESLDPVKFQVKEAYRPEDVASLLADGKILARSAGRMEFGARSLCNRAILADPVSPDVVPKINEAIKNRDFWMPFAPVVMDAYAKDYLVNPKRILSPHMSIGFQTTEAGWKAMPAGCHPADRTARAQLLTETANPEMYEILKAFAAKTGRGALLNTSFNLHGYPIVNTPEEALYVFENSQLDALVLNHYLIQKI